MSTDLIIDKISRADAMKIADIAEKYDGEYFLKTYGVVWPMKFSSYVIAAFVRARIRELRAWGYDMNVVKPSVSVKYIREMFNLNEFPEELWLGDTTTEVLINTYLLAFLHNGKHVEYDDSVEEDVSLDHIDGYEVISGDYAKKHSVYKGWTLYRAWNIAEDHGKMRYFAVKDSDVLEAKNLSGIKDKVNSHLTE